MACSSSQTFTVVDNGPCGKSGPVNVQLSRGLHPGMVLTVVASTTHRAGFNIKDKDGNIMLHVNPRIDQNVVVFNTHQCSWGPEERPSYMPITSGVKYCLHIAYESEGYRIFINGEEFHFYKHRINHPATLFELNEHIFLVAYKLNEPKWTIRQPVNGIYIQEFGCGGKEASYEMQLQGCNSLSWIVISGIVNCNASRFDVNLMSSCGEIIFHFNPRFTENRVVRNSRVDGHWGKEETSGTIVFQKNQKFVLAIDVENHCYKTYINGEEFITYNHRKPVNTVTKLQIANDVKLHKIIYQK